MYLLVSIVSIIVGVITGLFGFDGGLLLFPMLLHFGFTLKQVVAMLLFVNTIPNTLPGLWMYYKDGNLLWKPTIVIAVSTMVGVIAGSYLGVSNRISEKKLLQAYTFALAFVVIAMVCMQAYR